MMTGFFLPLIKWPAKVRSAKGSASSAEKNVKRSVIFLSGNTNVTNSLSAGRLRPVKCFSCQNM